VSGRWGAAVSVLRWSLQALYREHVRELIAFARRRVGDEASGDVVHDVFLRLATYGTPARLENPRAYLYRVTANAAHDHGRRVSARAEVSVPDETWQQLESPLAGPESTAEQHSLLIGCLAALDALPAPCRQVFLLHRIDGIPQAEIAATLGIPLRTVERHVAKAMACCLEAAR
jgi:RNA polymerase sigma factor (sigma-70 family)